MNWARTILALAGFSILAIVLEVFLVGEHEHGKGPSFYFTGLFALLSVAAAFLMIVAAKVLGHLFLERHEDYYD